MGCCSLFSAKPTSQDQKLSSPTVIEPKMPFTASTDHPNTRPVSKSRAKGSISYRIEPPPQVILADSPLLIPTPPVLPMPSYPVPPPPILSIKPQPIRISASRSAVINPKRQTALKPFELKIQPKINHLPQYEQSPTPDIFGDTNAYEPKKDDKVLKNERQKLGKQSGTGGQIKFKNFDMDVGPQVETPAIHNFSYGGLCKGGQSED